LTRVGLISDTHGLLRPEAAAALAGSDLIIHAGDIGDPAILTALGRIAPVTAVRGNIDKSAWAETQPAWDVLDVDATLIYVLHNIDELDLDPAAAGFQVVVYGHSHKPGIRRDGGVLFVNPGSAGPRRFSLPVTLGRLAIANGTVEAEIVTLTPS